MKPVIVTMLLLAGCATLPKGPQPNLLDEAQLCQMLRALEVQEARLQYGMVGEYDGPGEPKTGPIHVLVEMENLPSRWFQWSSANACKGVRFQAVNYAQDVDHILWVEVKREAPDRYWYYTKLNSLKDMKKDGPDQVVCLCTESEGFAHWRDGQWVVERKKVY